MTRDRVAIAGLYLGGFLGPFGGGVVSAMLPELGASFHVSPARAAASLTAFLVPFGLLMLVSGGLGQRWGVRRTVVSAYLAYVLASVVCVVAGSSGTFELFLAGRAAQGLANSFTLPLLLSTIAAVTPPARLGRALGWYGSLNAAGQTSAPLVGGLAAELDWRWAFVGVAAVALGCAVVGIPDPSRHGAAPPAPVPPAPVVAAPVVPAPEAPAPVPPAPLAAGPVGGGRAASAGGRGWLRPAVRAGIVAAAGWGALGGLSYLVALRMLDTFGLGAGLRGLLLTGFGISGVLTARMVGGFIDRFGARRCVVLGGLTGAVLVAGVGTVPWLVALAAMWAAAGVASQFVLVGLNAQVLSGTAADRRGAAVSVVQALRFLGGGAAPAVVTPVYGMSPAAAFLMSAAALVVIVPVAARPGRPPSGAQESSVGGPGAQEPSAGRSAPG